MCGEKKCVMKESSFVPQFLMMTMNSILNKLCLHCRENIFKLHCGEGLVH